ncbi:hypothetical protein D3C72_1998050 [compost metagenome]
MDLTDAVLCRLGQHGYVEGVMRHQFGEKRPAFQTAKPFGLDVGQIEEVFADGIPER